MSVTLKGVSRGAGEGYVRTDRAEFIASLDYDNETFLVSLTDPDGAPAYLWNLPCPEYDDRRWARYVFEGNEHTLPFGYGDLNPLNPYPVPAGAQGVGRHVPEWAILKVIRSKISAVHATSNDLSKAGVALSNPDQAGITPTQVYDLQQQYLVPGAINWTVSLAAYERVEQLLD